MYVCVCVDDKEASRMCVKVQVNQLLFGNNKDACISVTYATSGFVHVQYYFCYYFDLMNNAVSNYQLVLLC